MVVGNSLFWANWSVAIGTIAVAVATLALAWVTRRSVRTATDELRLERERLTASQWPRVFPNPPLTWSEGAVPYNQDPTPWPSVLPVKNRGPGVALNVRARLDWPARAGGVHVESVPTSLAPDDSADLRINWGVEPRTDWADVSGALTYSDITGAVWQTQFHVSIGNFDRRIVDVGETTRHGADPAVVTVGEQSRWRRIVLSGRAR
jgi:hypothetical protein